MPVLSAQEAVLESQRKRQAAAAGQLSADPSGRGYDPSTYPGHLKLHMRTIHGSRVVRVFAIDSTLSGQKVYVEGQDPDEHYALGYWDWPEERQADGVCVTVVGGKQGHTCWRAFRPDRIRLAKPKRIQRAQRRREMAVRDNPEDRQAAILGVLQKAKRPQTAAEIASQLKCSPFSLTARLKRMVQDGLLEALPGPKLVYRPAAAQARKSS